MKRVPSGWWIACVFAVLLSPCAGELRADDGPPSDGTLHLTNGGYVAGRLLASASGDEIAWQGTQFASPFQFPAHQVKSIVYPQPTTVPRPTGEFCFELSGHDVLYGSLRSVSEQTLEIDESKLGRIAVRRAHLRRFFRWHTGKELIFVGPAGLKGWTEGTPGQWREEGGQLATDQPEARLTGEFQLPEQFSAEFELSWSKRPNFAVALVGPGRPATESRAFRLEVIENSLVALREAQRDADLAEVAKLEPGEGRVQLLAYVDQVAGRFLIYSATGNLLADLQVKEPNPQLGGGFTLINFQGDLRLERLRISRWNGAAPTGSDADQPRLRLENGETQNGRLTNYDAERKTLTFRDGAQDKTIPLAQVEDVLLQTGAPADAVQNLHLTYQDGTRIGGTLRRIEAAGIVMECSAVVEAFSAPVAGLRMVHLLNPEPQLTEVPAHRETLELPGTKLRGQLVDGADQGTASCLVWEPELSRTAAALNKDVAGRVVYRIPPPPAKPPSTAKNINRRQAQAKMLNLDKLVTPVPMPKHAAAPAVEDRFLHLRSGDTIPCGVSAIDERGVTFTTSMSAATFVPHDKVKAVELIKTKSLPKIGKLKRERLLTLPRMQRDSPPTQLICSPTGDILRGRVLELTDASLKVEVRLDIRQVTRDRVSQIIWLHEEELGGSTGNAAPAKSAEEPAPTPPGIRVQVQRNDGIRLTYFADKLEHGTVFGRSEVLGECRTNLPQVDQLLIGDAIEQAAQALAYHRWKLHHAVDPKFVQEENGEGGPGEDSPLVGKAAPDFMLDALDGKPFKLSAHRGSVVVLDFWATWCGPCLQVMPQVEQVVGEFREHKVVLAAVNLEESPKQIKATLERHKLNVPVVLDQDGVVARKYAANAIPQTVVIDRSGTVLRVFVGGGPEYAEQLRDALQQALDAPQPDGAAATRSE